MNILYLSLRLPYPPHRGDRIRAFNFLKHLSQKHTVSLIAFHDEGDASEAVDALRNYCKEITLLPLNKQQSRFQCCLYAWSSVPLQVRYWYASAMRQAVRRFLDEKPCDVPLETCASFGEGAEYLVRNNLARKVSQSEMLEHLARSKEMGLVLNADNVKKHIGAICSCCPCCCNILTGILKCGYPGILVTSNFIAHVDESTCIGCALCARACPIHAISMAPNGSSQAKKKPQIDTSLCVGCGVCSLKCTKTESLKLVKRQKRVLHPETTMERVILQCLEQGTLQNQLFDDSNRLSHDILRAIVGAFLKLPPVKKSLMSDLLRSRFLGKLTTNM